MIMLSISEICDVLGVQNFTEGLDFTDFNLTELNCSGIYLNGTNSSVFEEKHTPYKDRPETYIVPFVFLVIFVTGIVGNFVIGVTIFGNAHMRNIPNYYIMSLAVGDFFLILTCVPVAIASYSTESWPFGLEVCKVTEFIKDMSIGISVFTLTALSADRYFAIVNPMKKLHATGGGKRAKRITYVVVGCIWIFAFAFATPAMYFSYLKNIRINSVLTIQVCYPFPEKSALFGTLHANFMILIRLFLYYVFPLIVIAVFYMLMAKHLVQSTRNIPGEMQGQVKQVKARKKVAKIVKILVVIFMVSFFPQHAFMVWFYFCPSSEADYNLFWHITRIVGFCMAFMNSCINPIALCWVSGSFRKYFKRYLLCYCSSENQLVSNTGSQFRRGHSYSSTTSRRHTSSRRPQQIQLPTWPSTKAGVRTTFLDHETTVTTGCINGTEQRM